MRGRPCYGRAAPMSALQLDEAGRPLAAHDPHGTLAWRLRWRDDALVHAWLRLPDRDDAIELEPSGDDDPLLGRCDRLLHRGQPIARMSAVAWAAPANIPAVDRPGALPPGAGTCVLDLVATLAQHAGVPTLRYRGPYPTAALFESLRHSFTIDGDVALARQRFDDALERAAWRGLVVEPEVDLRPAPHRRSWPAPGICLQRRDGIERAWIDGRPYDAADPTHALVPDDDGGVIARVRADGETLGEVARLDRDGIPRGPIARALPHPPELVGLELPPALVDVLAQVLAAAAPAPVRDAVHGFVQGSTLRFDDLGLALASVEPGLLRVHAALAEPVSTATPSRSLGLLAGVLQAPVLRGVQRQLAAR